MNDEPNLAVPETRDIRQIITFESDSYLTIDELMRVPGVTKLFSGTKDINVNISFGSSPNGNPMLYYRVSSFMP